MMDMEKSGRMSKKRYSHHDSQNDSSPHASELQEEVIEDLRLEDLPLDAVNNSVDARNGNRNGHGSSNESDAIIKASYERGPSYERDSSTWGTPDSQTPDGSADYGAPRTRDHDRLAATDNARSLGNTPAWSAPAALTNWGANWTGDEEKWDESPLRRFMAMLSRRRRIVWTTLLATVAIAIVFKWLAPPVYRATATLQVHPATDAAAAGSNDLPVVSDLIGGIYQTRSTDTQIEILKSRPVQES